MHQRSIADFGRYVAVDTHPFINASYVVYSCYLVFNRIHEVASALFCSSVPTFAVLSLHFRLVFKSNAFSPSVLTSRLATLQLAKSSGLPVPIFIGMTPAIKGFYSQSIHFQLCS